MKKLFSILLLFVCAFAFSQSQLSTIKENGVTYPLAQGPIYGYFWGAAGDTLVASDSLSQVIRVKAEGLLQVAIKEYVVKVSGTVTNKTIIYKSMLPSPYKWEKVDSIVYSNASTGYSADKTLSNWYAPFMLIRKEAGATAQKANYKTYFTFKY